MAEKSRLVRLEPPGDLDVVHLSSRCTASLDNACSRLCPGTTVALYDLGHRDGYRFAWRCYAASAVTPNGSYDGSSTAYCSSSTKLLAALQGPECSVSQHMPELRPWPAASGRHAECAGRGSDLALPLSEPACSQPTNCSSFARVVVALQVSRAERVPSLLAYRHWFAAVWLLTFGVAECTLCGRLLAEANDDARRVRCECLELSNTTRAAFLVHETVAPALHRALLANPDASGVLFLHFDVVFNVRRFHAGVDVDAFWTPRGGLPRSARDPCCYPVSNLRDGSHWMLPAGVAAPNSFSAYSEHS
eukprot:2462231-Prymnesium_polylepis.1